MILPHLEICIILVENAPGIFVETMAFLWRQKGWDIFDKLSHKFHGTGS